MGLRPGLKTEKENMSNQNRMSKSMAVRSRSLLATNFPVLSSSYAKCHNLR